MARDADPAEETAVADPGWAGRARLRLSAAATAAAARAKRSLLAAAAAGTDSGIALLQRLRERAAQAGPPDADRGDRDAGARRGRPADRARTAGAPDAQASVKPRPRRRLRAALVYLGVMLAGAMFGTALAYDLLGQLLERRAAEVARREAELSKLSRSVAALKQGLERQQQKRIEAENRLAGVVAESEAKQRALQTQQAALQQRLAGGYAARAGDVRGQQDARSLRDAGECTLGGGDVAAVLKGCIEEMNRR